MGALDGQTAIVTGSTRGLGKAIAAAYVLEGARVTICGRNDKTAEATCFALREQTGCKAEAVLWMRCDVINFNQVSHLIDTVISDRGHLDILVNNAASQHPISRFNLTNLAMWDETFATNVLGPLYATQRAIGYMWRQGRGKIINISGGGATKPQPGMSAYAASKAALVRLTETMALELRGTGVDINAVAPGALNTLMQDEVIAAGPQIVGEQRYQEALKIKETGGDSLEEAAALCVWLASHASDGLSGKLISAKWDDWRHLDIPKVMASDWGTLRRIDKSPVEQEKK